MSMHLIRGVTSLPKRSKQNKKPGWQQAQQEHDEWLMKMGAHPSQRKKSKKGIYDIPDYKSQVKTAPTSDFVGGSTAVRKENQYTGDEIAGVGTLHKSNMVPIRKDNKEAAREIATMRRN